MEAVAKGGASVVQYSPGQLEGGLEPFALVDSVKGGGLEVWKSGFGMLWA